MKTYFKSVDINNFIYDSYNTKTKKVNHTQALQLQRIDITLVTNLRNYIYKNLKDLIKFSFLDLKVNMET